MATALAPSRSSRELVVTLPALHPAQQRVVDEAGRFNVLQCGRRFGKTTLGIDRLIDPALDGFPVAWFAPTYKFLADAWREALRLLRPVLDEVSEKDKRITLITGGVLEFWTLDTPDAGRSRKYKHAGIDEAGVVRDLAAAWNEAIRPTLTDLRGDAWFYGTPKGRGYFHELYLRGQSGRPGWKSWRFGTAANPHISASEVEDARRDMPEAAFRQEYLGEPADDAGNPFGMTAIRACVAPLAEGAEPVVWGWDLAKSEDWCVGIALDSEGRACRLERWQGPWEMTLAKIAALTGTTRALVDSTGVGDPVLEALQKRCPNAEGFKFSAQSKQQLMEGLAVALHQGAVRYPDGVVVHELEAFQYEYTKAGVRYSAPAGLHDDCVCALALAVHLKARPVAAPAVRSVPLW